MRAPAAIVLGAFAGLLLTGARVLAHEIGTARVSVVLLEQGRYELEVVTDAVSLLDKLETVSGGSPADMVGPAALRQRLEQLDTVFQQRVVIAFDGQQVQPAVSWSVAQPSTVGGNPVATIRLAGNVPPSAHYLSWKYSWTFTSYALIARRGASGLPTTEWLEGGQTSTPLSLNAAAPEVSRLRLAWRYVVLGFTHILPKGLDHVLFVLGIVLLSRRLRPILLQISAFTVAHSITLALSMYGLVTLPSSIVEPAIALSIAYIALENVFLADLKPWRLALVFAFGLLHGLGFAGALRDVGLPRAEFLTALIGFNAGVELGQLAVIAAAFLSVGYWCSDRIWYRRRIVLPASMCIAFLGIYWTFERLRYVV
ncbi:MAG: HupE/UreJ family protein [Acidobacteria bacterium]|nr:HupE/UreJ family protein [Acidobacteriota bacterium]